MRQIPGRGSTPLRRHPMLPIDFIPVLFWFTGKARERAQEAIKQLNESIAAGYWLPGVSRKVRAALNKCNVAHKATRRDDFKALAELRMPDGGALSGGWHIAHQMSFGMELTEDEVREVEQKIQLPE